MKGLSFVFISIFFNILGQLSLKRAANDFDRIDLCVARIFSTAFYIFTRLGVVLGLVLYGISAFFWIIALSKVELSRAYPMLSIGYLGVLLLSWWFLNEHITSIRLLGIVAICLGVYLVAKS